MTPSTVPPSSTATYDAPSALSASMSMRLGYSSCHWGIPIVASARFPSQRQASAAATSEASVCLMVMGM